MEFDSVSWLPRLWIRFRLSLFLELVVEVRDSVFQSQSDWSLLPTAPLVPNFVGSVDAPPRGSSVVIIFVMPASQVGFEERSNGGEVRRKHAL